MRTTRGGMNWAGLALLLAALVAGCHDEPTAPDSAVRPMKNPRMDEVLYGPVVAISAGYVRTCAIGSDGAIACWGDGTSGSATAQAGPFDQVSTGGSHTCGLRPNGSVHCWGDNEPVPIWWTPT